MKKTISILVMLALILTTVLVPVSAYAASDSEVAMPKFSKKEGTYTKSVKLTLTAEKGAKIYYTTDGSKPTTKSKEYTKAITITKTTRVRAIAVKDGVKSKIRSREYTIKVKKPTVKYEEVLRNGENVLKVTLTPMDSKTTMYYTTDGEKPTKKSKKYTKSIYVDYGDTVKVRSYKTGCTSRTVTLELPKASHTEKDDYVNDGGQATIDSEVTGRVAGKMAESESAKTNRPAPNPGADKKTAVESLNNLAFYTYGGLRFFDDGIAENYEDEGKFAKFVTHSDGRTGINVFGWRKSYDSSTATNACLNVVLEAFYYMTGDRQVAKALWDWIDANNINGGGVDSTNYGFRDVRQTSNGWIIEMNGIQLELDNSVRNSTILYFN